MGPKRPLMPSIATVDDRGQAIYVLGKPGADNPWKLLRYRPAYGAWDELS